MKQESKRSHSTRKLPLWELLFWRSIHSIGIYRVRSVQDFLIHEDTKREVEVVLRIFGSVRGPIRAHTQARKCGVCMYLDNVGRDGM